MGHYRWHRDVDRECAPLNVQAIQITVKYLDPTQNLLRQVTIVQSLTLTQ